MQAWRNGTRSSWRRLSSKSTALSRYPGQQEMLAAVHGHAGQCRPGTHHLSQPQIDFWPQLSKPVLHWKAIKLSLGEQGY